MPTCPISSNGRCSSSPPAQHSLNFSVASWLAWLFIAGRVAHSGVQILTRNVRLRGLVFTINFLAVLGLWAAVVLALAGKPAA
ncbi:MAPEG family protein [Pseudomonas sp. NY15437]|uniref:MAPEG family protein n=1 Tax=Pseudomonas sp. NY15437 TaxID=3400360 RepID=UPI003A8A3F95